MYYLLQIFFGVCVHVHACAGQKATSDAMFRNAIHPLAWSPLSMLGTHMLPPPQS